MASDRFSLCWDEFHKNLSGGLQSLLQNEVMVDVTLAVEGRYLKAHKMILSLCSPYFRELFESSPCQHPIVFLKDVTYEALSDLLQFMYYGEVQVAQEDLTSFIKTAEALSIKGLSGDSNSKTETEFKEPQKFKSAGETAKRTLEADPPPKPSPANRVKKFMGPASKRPKYLAAESTTNVSHDATPAKSESEKVSQSSGESAKDNPAGSEGGAGVSNSESTSNEAESNQTSTTEEANESKGVFKFIINESGTQDLILHQHVYKFDKLVNGSKLWICAGDKDCSAKCYTVSGKVQSKIGIHSHPPPVLKERQGQIVSKKLD